MASLLDPALLARLKPLELRARGVVEGFLTGLHRSPYHGFSAEFAEHRAYNPGDELRHLDWKVLAKTDRPYIKRFEEETNLRALLVLDTSASMRYAGSAPMTKLDYGATLAAALAVLLLRQRDAVGLAAFDTTVHTVVPPRSASAHLRPIVAALEAALTAEPPPTRTAAASALTELAERLSRRSLVVVMSDLYETEAGQRIAGQTAPVAGGAADVGDAGPGDTGEDALLRALRRLRHRGHEVLVFRLLDRATERDLALPDGRPLTLLDRETGERVTLDPAHAREAFAAAATAASERLRRGCLEHGIAFDEVDTAAPLDEALVRFLAARRRAR